MSRFDRVMGLAILVILAGIGVTLLLGDRVGITIERAAPQGEARSTSTISLQFSEAMNHESAEAHFSTEPASAGEFSWSGRTLVFQPAQPWTPGDTVQVLLAAGAVGESGRRVLNDTAFSFSVRQPEAAYLYPATGSPQNIWIARPGEPESARQVTFSPSGIFDFSVSPDGAQIAFSERDSASGVTDIKLLDLSTGGLTQLTNCENASCTGPVWRPDGQSIAYERTERDGAAASPGGDASSARVWLLDLSAAPATTRPLMSDLQMLGHSPQWSGDGQMIAFYSTNLAAIIVYNLETGQVTSVPSSGGSAGALSPDGTKLAYPDITVSEGTGVITTLWLADLVAGGRTRLTGADSRMDDSRALWRPDGQALAVARRDERAMRGYQVVEMDPLTGDVRPLTTDPRYSNMLFWWDAAGSQLVLQRFPELDESGQPNLNGRPEIWTLDAESGALTLVAEDGMLPRWVP